MRKIKAAEKSDKRKHPRFPVGISLDIRAGGQSVTKSFGRIVDLSMGGMAFTTDTALEKGMSLYLKVNIPLEIRGEVCHIKGSSLVGPRRYGVRFHKIGYLSPEASKPQNFISAKFNEKKP